MSTLNQKRQAILNYCGKRKGCNSDCPLFTTPSHCIVDDNAIDENYQILVEAGLLPDGSLGPITDAVNHPSHYNDGKIEVIKYIEDKGLARGFCLGNAIKYISRAGKKDPTKEIEDLEKALFYIKYFIDYLKRSA